MPGGERLNRRVQPAGQAVSDVLDTVENEDQGSLDDVPDFLFRMMMLMEIDRIGGDLPPSERHVLSMEELARPSIKRSPGAAEAIADILGGSDRLDGQRMDNGTDGKGQAESEDPA